MTDTTTPEIRGILVCKDLFFMAGVTATAKSLGLGMKVCPGLTSLKATLDENPETRVVIIDMALMDPSEPQVWMAIRNLVSRPMILAGFGSHVDIARFEAARGAGFDHVLAKSLFSGQMVDWLNSWMA